MSESQASNLCTECNTRLAPDDRFCSRCGAISPSAQTDSVDVGSTENEKIEDALRHALSPQYVLLGSLGAGGMGEVFLAREPALKRLVAVKVLLPAMAVDPSCRVRFEREAEAVASISHPNVVSVYGVGELSDGTPYFVMQYVPGQSLASRLKTEGTFSLAETKRALGETASALAAAHARGIVHRDVKPANLLYDDDSGRVLVSDFGIAAVRPDSSSEPNNRITQTGMAVGTPAYMSPEQLLAEDVTDRSDVYALGLTAYELLANRGPFEVTSPNELTAAHLRDEPTPLSSIRPDMDPEFEGLVARCLNKNPEDRPAAKDVARQLIHGAGALLEWPPPGLERLCGSAWRLAMVWVPGSLLFSLAVLLLAGIGPSLSWAQSSFATLFIWIVAFVGAAISLSGAALVLRMARISNRALVAGFSWYTLLEVMADRRRDTGAVITGTREYTGLSPRRRNQLRQERVLRAVLAVLAGVYPIPMLFVCFWLAARGQLGLWSSFLAVLVPPVIAVVISRWLEERREHLVVRVNRAAIEARHMPSPGVVDLVAPWYESFEGARVDQPLGRGPDGKPVLAWIGAGVAAFVLVVGPILLGSIGLVGVFGSKVFDNVAVPTWDYTYLHGSYLRQYAVSHDSSISTTTASQAFNRLTYLSDARPTELGSGDGYQRKHPLRRINESELRDWDTNPFAALPRVIADTVMSRVFSNFTSEQVRFLETVTSHPNLPDIATVARAPNLDVMAARFQLPFSDTVIQWDLPRINLDILPDLSAANVIRAALLLRRGEQDSAEVVLRETITLGLRLIDAEDIALASRGRLVLLLGRRGLERFYGATGRSNAAEELRVSYDSLENLADEALALARRTGTGRLLSGNAARRALVRMLGDSTRIPFRRWEALSSLSLAPCSNARELLFGTDPEILQAFESAKHQLVTLPGQDALFELIVESPLRFARTLEASQDDAPLPLFAGFAFGMAKLTGRILNNERIPGCVGLVMSLG